MIIDADPATRWNPENQTIRGKYYLDERVTSTSSPVKDILTVCQQQLRPGWEHRDTFLTHNDDLLSATSNHHRELSFVFENPNNLDLKSVVYLDDLRQHLNSPSPLRPIFECDSWRISEMNGVINQKLEETPYRCSESWIGFNHLKQSSPFLYQMGVLIFQFDLEDSRRSARMIQARINGKQDEITVLEAQLARIKPLTLNTFDINFYTLSPKP